MAGARASQRRVAAQTFQKHRREEVGNSLILHARTFASLPFRNQVFAEREADYIVGISRNRRARIAVSRYVPYS